MCTVNFGERQIYPFSHLLFDDNLILHSKTQDGVCIGEEVGILSKGELDDVVFNYGFLAQNAKLTKMNN